MNRITHILLFLLLLFGSSFETIDMVTYKGPLKCGDNKHQSNKGDHQDVAIDDLIILKYRNLNLKEVAAKRSAAFYYNFVDTTAAIYQSSIYGVVSNQSRQLRGFGHLHLYYIY
ncbi:hypothetical protein U0035_19000 [Niabella yanshanensis]|uniref:DUF4294 domain-containing protein n=1 Tax=Niabella yanshanensis TaxID=577386 RepID=A0ABZ0W4W8_9BACT|nr:hypothetical protein [Niabella yanshanensis]WQD37759.1 hypothetical protein U0035_19000 [Niabella yanshanensis]